MYEDILSLQAKITAFICWWVNNPSMDLNTLANYLDQLATKAREVADAHSELADVLPSQGKDGR